MGRGARRLAGDHDRSTVEPELEHLIFGTGDDGVDRSSEVYNLEVWQA